MDAGSVVGKGRETMSETKAASGVEVATPVQEGEDWQRYETALMRFQQHVKRTDDGTFRLDAEDGKSIGVDEALFADLKSSLEVTNRKIRQGELDTNQVHYVLYRK
jgi:hypothetical protein